MNGQPYERFRNADLILRDELAIDRTILANERTLLSYVRTGLALVVTGAGTARFFHTASAYVLAIVLCLFGAAVIALGAWKYCAMARSIAVCRRKSAASAPEAHRGSADNGA